MSLAELQVAREEEITRNPLSKVDISLDLLRYPVQIHYHTSRGHSRLELGGI